MPSPAPTLLQRLRGFFGSDNSTQSNAAVQDPAVGTIAQAAPGVIAQTTDTLNPPNPTSSAKESREPSVTLERPQIDMAGGLQSVEQERVAEISPEVESFIAEVEEHQDQLPQEIVIADIAAPVPTTKYLAKPVVILPITHEIEKEGAKKAPQFSVRWLVEWSRKMMKIFAGEVVYKEVK